MFDGSHFRRSVPGFAPILLTMVLALAGCQQLPVPRPQSGNTTDSPPAVATSTGPELVEEADDAIDKEPLPPLPVVQAAQVKQESSPTPILDAALKRAELIQHDDPDVPLEEAPPTDEAIAHKDGEPVAQTDDESIAHQDAEKDLEPGSTGSVSHADVTPEKVANAVKPQPKHETSSKPIDPEKPAVIPSPQELWDEGIGRLKTLAEEQRQRSGLASEPWSLRRRWLEVLARSEEEQSAHGAELCRTVLASLVPTHRDVSPSENSPGEAIRCAVAALEELAPLEIVDLRLCRKVNGFGSFEPLDPSNCKAGQNTILYCEMSGLSCSKADDQFRSRLRSRVEIRSAETKSAVWRDDLGTAEDRCRRHRRDYFINYLVKLPDDLPPGPYELRVTQEDEISGRSTSSTIPLTIVP